MYEQVIKCNICQACLCGRLAAAGRDGDARIGSKSPTALWCPLAHGPANHGYCAGNQQTPNVSLPILRRFPEALFATGGVLSWNKPNPGSKVPTPSELIHRWCKGLDRQSANRPYPAYRLQPARHRRRPGHGFLRGHRHVRVQPGDQARDGFFR